MLLSDYTLQVQELVHDLSNLDFTQAELTSFVNQGRQRVAMDLHCVRAFFTNLTFITGQEYYPMSGGIGGCAVTNGGSGYTSVPTVNISAPPAGGIQATATALLTNQVVTQVVMTNWGSGYTTTPSVSISGGGGSLATAQAIALTNVLDINAISVLTTLSPPQRFTLDWLPFSMFQAFFRASQLTTSYPGIWTSFEGAMPAFGPNAVNLVNPFLIAPIPNQNYVGEIDAVVQIDTSNFLVNPTDVDTQIFQPNSDAVQYYAAYKALMKLQNFEHAEKMEAKYERRIGQIQPTKRTRRIPNIYRNAYQRIARWMG
jgi:hypothetical protein